MAFVYKRGTGAYLRIRRLDVNSVLDKTDEAQGDYNYTVQLNQEFQNVVSISITGWNLPRDITPSFWPPNGGVQGNDTLDFSLTNPDLNGGNPYNLSIQLPNQLLYWSPIAPGEANLANVLNSLFAEAIAAEPDFVDFGEPFITITAEYLFGQNLLIVCTTDNFLISQFTELTFTFLSGPNTDRACNVQLGFPIKDDYTSYINPLIAGVGGIPYVLISPSITNLQLFKYVDVFIRESNQVPNTRIYLTNPNAFRTAPSNAAFRIRNIDTDQPPRVLNKLSISIKLPGFLDPRLYQSRDDLETQFTFSILQVADENDNLPPYLSQTLTW